VIAYAVTTTLPPTAGVTGNCGCLIWVVSCRFAAAPHDVRDGSLAGLADWAAPTRGMAASDRERLITLVPVSRYSLIDQGTAADNVHREAFIVTVSVPVS
jgi:hypothetical protein